MKNLLTEKRWILRAQCAMVALPCALTWVQLRLLPPLSQPPPPAQTSPATGTEKSTPTLGTATGTTGAATQMATVPTTHR